MSNINAITVHPEIQDGEPVFSGTRIRVETFYDFIRIGVSVSEFLNEFPSITRDQVMEVYDLVRKEYTVDQIKTMASASDMTLPPSFGRMYAA